MAGRRAETTLDDITNAILEMGRPATQAEIAEHLGDPRGRIKTRLHRDGDGFDKTSAGAYWPKGYHPMLLTDLEQRVILAMRGEPEAEESDTNP